MTDATYEPGTYRNGDRVRIAETPSDAVAAVFDGFALDTEDESVGDTDTVENGDAPETSGDDVPKGNEPAAAGGARGLFS